MFGSATLIAPPAQSLDDVVAELMIALVGDAVVLQHASEDAESIGVRVVELSAEETMRLAYEQPEREAGDWLAAPVSSDLAKAETRAREVAKSEAEALALLGLARERVRNLVGDELFQQQVSFIAEALLAYGELDGSAVVSGRTKRSSLSLGRPTHPEAVGSIGYLKEVEDAVPHDVGVPPRQQRGGDPAESRFLLAVEATRRLRVQGLLGIRRRLGRCCDRRDGQRRDDGQGDGPIHAVAAIQRNSDPSSRGVGGNRWRSRSGTRFLRRLGRTGYESGAYGRPFRRPGVVSLWSRRPQRCRKPRGYVTVRSPA
jgi:hypothetical protein